MSDLKKRQATQEIPLRPCGSNVRHIARTAQPIPKPLWLRHSLCAPDHQPPYSPELNPAERVFELLREPIEGKVNGSLPAKKKAVEAELERLAADPKQVRRLAGWEWIRCSSASLKQENMALH